MTTKDFRGLGIIDQAIEKQGTDIKNQKRLIWLVIASIILFATVYGLYYYVSRVNPSTSTTTKSKFYDLAEILVSIPNADKNNYLKLKLTICGSDEQLGPQLDNNMPIVRDALITFLRELSPSDIVGSSGTLLIKQEIIKRLNKTLYPARVEDILFKEFMMN